MIKLFIVEDQEIYLEGLCLLLQKDAAIEITGTAGKAADVLAILAEKDIDVLMLDVHLPDMSEEELLKKIRAIKPHQKVVYLTMMRGTRYIHKLLKHNIQGYVLKSAAINELMEAIKTVAKGGTYYSKEIDVITDDDFRSTVTVESNKVSEILSKREIEILKLVCKEYSNAAIAEKLFLSVSTVETHRKNLIAKLGVSNTVGLVKFALKNNLIE